MVVSNTQLSRQIKSSLGAECPCADAVCCQDTLRSQRRRKHHAFHDVGAAISNLSTQAIALDLFVHQMAGFDAEKARWRSLSERESQFSIPSGYELVAMLAIEYLGDPQTLPAASQDRELASRTRKPLTEFYQVH